MKFKPENIKLAVGLGNPGKKYEKTYHNAGYLCIDYLKEHLPPTRYKLKKTDCLMNRSGQFVKETLNTLNTRPEEMLIIHDDADIKIENYKMSFDRGSGGHNGVKSIIDKLGSKKFWRCRIGIRESEDKRKSEEFILKKIPENNLDRLERVFQDIAAELKKGEKI